MSSTATATTTTATTTKTATAVPDLATLERGLTHALGHDARPVHVVHRRPNRQESTFPSEVLTCRLPDATELRLFVKYADRSVNHVFGHRSGVEFESRVYRDVLTPLSLTTPRYYGHYEEDDHEGARTWLILEALDEIARVHKDPRPEAMPQAAEWIGRFHRLNEPRVEEFTAWVHRYDAAYFQGWCRRTADYVAGGRPELAWVADLCGRCEAFLPEALSGRPTLIHGEYYPKNILSCRGAIYPVDWESVAVATGEIDFASLLERWPRTDVVRRCRDAYATARWPDGAPADFERTLAAAQLYLHTRWLGNRREWGAGSEWRVDSMRHLAGELGLC